MKQIILISLLSLSSCIKVDQSELMIEKGVLLEKHYSPDTRQTVSGSGFSTSGNVTFSTYEVGEKERYILLFKCEHGVVFSVEDKKSYYGIEENDSVEIKFKEVYHNGKFHDYKYFSSKKL